MERLKGLLMVLGAFALSVALIGCSADGGLKIPGLPGIGGVGDFLAAPAPDAGADLDDPRVIAIDTAFTSGGGACLAAVALAPDIGVDLKGSVGAVRRILTGEPLTVDDLDFAFRAVEQPGLKVAGQLLVRQFARVLGATGAVPTNSTGIAMVSALLDGCDQAIVIGTEAAINESFGADLSIQFRMRF